MSVTSRVLIVVICCVVVVAVAPLAVRSNAAAESSDSAKSPRTEERFEFTSYAEVNKLFEELNYTPEAWQDGIREVPRVYLTTIAPRWRSKGIKPQQQREGMGDYRIAAFESPLQSIMAYMRNLNTHNAYASLRERRGEMRAKGERISGWELAKSLDRYSERGPAYVESLHAIMRVNRLDPADDAFLGDGPTIFLVPVGEGAS